MPGVSMNLASARAVITNIVLALAGDVQVAGEAAQDQQGAGREHVLCQRLLELAAAAQHPCRAAP